VRKYEMKDKRRVVNKTNKTGLISCGGRRGSTSGRHQDHIQSVNCRVATNTDH